MASSIAARTSYFGETVAIKDVPGAISDRLDGTTVAPTDSSSEEIYELGRRNSWKRQKILEFVAAAASSQYRKRPQPDSKFTAPPTW